MSRLVTLGEVVVNLRLQGTPVGNLQEKIDQAEAIVIDRILQRVSDQAAWTGVVDAWDVDEAPAMVKAAIYHQTAELYRFNGDDLAIDAPSRASSGLSHFVEYIVKRYGDPAVA